MNSSIARLSLAGSFLLVLASPAPAFTPAAQLPFSTDDVRSLSFLPDPEGPSTLLSADLDQDFREEVIVLQGGRLTVFFGAASFGAVSRAAAPDSVTSVAVLPGQGSSGQDILLTVGSGGVQTWEFNLDTDQLDPTTLAIPGWEAVSRIAVGDIGLDGVVDDVAGISASGHSVFVAANITTSPINYPVLQSAELVLDLVFLDAYSNAVDSLELAMLRDSSVLVMDAQGALSTIPLSPLTAGRVAVLTADGVGRDSLAVASLEVSRADYSLTVVAMGQTEPVVSLKVPDLVGISAADVDSDGDVDLVISRATGGDLMVLLASYDGVNTFHEPVEGVNQVSTNGSTPGTLGEPLLADLNRDGRPDLLYPRWMNGNSDLLMFKNVPVTAATAQGFEVLSSLLMESVQPEKFNDNISLRLPHEDVSLPSLEIIVWLHEFEASGTNQQATRIEHILTPNWTVTGAESQPIGLTLDESMNGLFPQIPLFGQAGFFSHAPIYGVTGDLFFYEFRAVSLVVAPGSTTGYKVIDAGESFFIAHFSLQKDLSGETSILEDYWPKLVEIGQAGYYNDFYVDTDNTTDLAAQAEDQEMKDLESDVLNAAPPGSTISVRVVDPGEFPIPDIPGITGGGRPKTTTATLPLDNN